MCIQSYVELHSDRTYTWGKSHHYCLDNLIQNSPVVKKGCGHCEKRYEIQEGSQEMAVMVG